MLVVPRETDEEILNFFKPYNVEFEFFDKVLDISNAEGISAKLQRQMRRISSEIAVYNFFKKKHLENSVIHIEYAPWQSWILLSKLASKTNVIVTLHNGLSKQTNWRESIWSKRLNYLLKLKNFQIFAANQNTIDNFKERIKPDFWHKLKLTRACINSKQLKEVGDAVLNREDLLIKHNLPTDKFIVLCVGNFIDRKGRWVFLESAKEIVKENNDVIFVWLMPNLPTKEERQKIKNYNILDSFYPIKSSDVGTKRLDVLTFFRIADVFALPSFIEGLPITLLEAMGLGVTTVSTNINAIPEAVKNFETGILVESGNSRDLTDAILLLKNDQEVRKKLAENGKNFVLENFDEAYWAKVALEEYRKCFEG